MQASSRRTNKPNRTRRRDTNVTSNRTPGASYHSIPQSLNVTLAMLLPPLARACRPGLRAFPPRPLHSAIAARVFTSSPLHRKDVHGNRPASVPPGQAAKQATPLAAKLKAPSPKDALLAEQTVSNKEQRKADWAIIREMSHYLWPKDNMGARFRVALSVGLLVGAKVLNVQVPFYFKNIVDSMNIDFAAVGGTATTVAGSMIVACKPPNRPVYRRRE